MYSPIEDPRRSRVFDANPENLEALAEILNTYSHKLDQAIDLYDGEKRLRKAFEFNDKCKRAYQAISRLEMSEEELKNESYLDEVLTQDTAVLEHELLGVDTSDASYFHEAEAKLLEAERQYLDVVRRAEEEIDWIE
mgnify:FL=1